MVCMVEVGDPRDIGGRHLQAVRILQGILSAEKAGGRPREIIWNELSQQWR